MITAQNKAEALKEAFGDKAIEAATEVLNAIKHKCISMERDIDYWNQVIEILKQTPKRRSKRAWEILIGV